MINGFAAAAARLFGASLFAPGARRRLQCVHGAPGKAQVLPRFRLIGERPQQIRGMVSHYERRAGEIETGSFALE